MRFRRSFSTFLGVLGTLLIGVVVTLFLVFPRVVNQLADLLGNMGTGAEGSPIPVDIRQGVVHVLIALVIDAFLFYFFIWRPTNALRESYQITGLVVRKGEGQAFIDTESVRQRVLNAVAKVADIQHADVVIDNDNGRAVIKLNIITDLALNGPQKKNEINREVRKIVKDQLGIEVSGQPTINFTLAPEQPPVPLISAGIPPREALVAEPVRTPSPEPVITTIPEPEPEAPPPPPVGIHTPEPETPPAGPSGIELSKSEPLPYRGSTIPSPAPLDHDETDDSAEVTEYPPADSFTSSYADDDRPIDEA